MSVQFCLAVCEEKGIEGNRKKRNKKKIGGEMRVCVLVPSFTACMNTFYTNDVYVDDARTNTIY